MAIKAEVERRCRIAMEEIFGRDVEVTTTASGNRVTVTVTGATIQAGREHGAPVEIAGAVRDVIRSKFTKEEIATLAQRRRTTPEEVERTLAADVLRERDARRSPLFDPSQGAA